MQAVILISIILIILTGPCSPWEKNSNSLVSSIKPVSEIGTAALNTNNVMPEDAGQISNGDVGTIESGAVEQAQSNYQRGIELPSHFHFQPYLDHPIVFHPEQWSVGQATGTVVNYHTDMYLQYRDTADNLPLGQKLARFLYQKGSMKFDIVVQGAAMAQGRLIVAFDPNPFQSVHANTGLADVMTLARAHCVPHIIVDPSQTKTYSITLPCPTVSGVWTRDMGSYDVTAMVLAPLASGTASTPIVTICYYVSMQNTDMGPMSYYAASLVEARSGGVLSTAFKKAGDIAKSVSVVPIPVISEGATLFSSAATSIGDFLSWFGFGKPILVDRTIVSNNGFNNTPYFDSQVQSALLSSRINNSITFDPQMTPLMSLEDQEVSKICSIPGFINQMVVNTSDTTGTLIHTMPVSPAYSTQYESTTAHCTPLMFAAMFYRYWSGEITVKFDIVASVFHRCTLVFVYEPGSLDPDTPFESLLQSNKHWIVVVSGNTELVVTIPWSQKIPFKHVGPYNTTNSLLPECANGYIKVFLVNPVTTNGSSAPIQINTYTYSNNIQFGQIDPTLNVTYATTSLAYKRTMGEEAAHTFKEIAARDSAWTEVKIASNANIAQGTRLVIEHPLLPNIGMVSTALKPTNGTNSPWTVSDQISTTSTCLADIVSLAYVGNRGSVRYTIPEVGFKMYGNLYVSDRASYNQFSVQKNASEPTFFGTSAMAILNTVINGNPSFTIPYYNPWGYFRTTLGCMLPDIFDPFGDFGSAVRVYIPYEFDLPDNNTTASFGTYTVLKAAGDDMTFVGFRGMRKATISKSVSF